MARRTQGTAVWAVVPHKTQTGKFELLRIECALNFKAGTDSKEKHETTCLENEGSKSYMAGISDAGQASFDINLDPKQPSHVRLYELSKSGQEVEWVIGWSGKDKEAVKNIVPVLESATGVVNLPATRSWNKFKGYVEDFPFEWESNSIVKCTVSVQRTTAVEWIPES